MSAAPCLEADIGALAQIAHTNDALLSVERRQVAPLVPDEVGLAVHEVDLTVFVDPAEAPAVDARSVVAVDTPKRQYE